MQATLLSVSEPPVSEPLSDLRRLPDSELLSRTKSAVADERQALAAVLQHLREVWRRRLFASLGYPSLFAYCTQELGYSEASAQRRISAMHLIRELPEVERAVAEGAVSLSNASLLQTFLRKEEKESKVSYSREAKRELLEKVSHVSARECEKRLAAISPVVLLPQEKERVVSPTQTEVRFLLDERLREKLERVKGLLSHRLKNPSYAELLEAMADLALQKLDPAEKRVRAQSRRSESHPTAPASSTPASSAPTSEPAPALGPATPTSEPASQKTSSRSRHVPAALRREIWRRDQGRCTYRDPRTGRSCLSRYRLEIEHREPFAHGGAHEVGNLTLRCRAHNFLSAIRTYGEKKMGEYLRL